MRNRAWAGLTLTNDIMVYVEHKLSMAALLTDTGSALLTQ